MANRINRAIQLLQQDQAIYYSGHHSGHVLTHAQGVIDAQVWSDYINIGMEHGSFDLAGLAEYLRGLVDGGPTKSGHRTPTVVCEAPVNGIDEDMVRNNAWQFRQLLGRGIHGIILCQAETAGAVRAFIESCRYPHHLIGTDPELPGPVARMRAAPGTPRPKPADGMVGLGMRGKGSEHTAAPVWGLSDADYISRADVWPLNPDGELMLGVKLERPEGVANCDEILAVPGLAYAEMGPGDLSLSLGMIEMKRDPYPADMQYARDRIFAACRRNGLAFLEAASHGTIKARLDEGVRVIAGMDGEGARIGRTHQKREMAY